jgi:hypothetical protein
MPVTKAFSSGLSANASRCVQPTKFRPHHLGNTVGTADEVIQQRMAEGHFRVYSLACHIRFDQRRTWAEIVKST